MDKIVEGYKQEIEYQKHMIENLGRWLTLSIMVAAIGLTLVYFFPFQHNKFPAILGWVLIVIGILSMFIFSYGIYSGRRNVNRVIDDLERRLHS